MLGILFDSNVYLGAVLPDHPWKRFIDQMMNRLTNSSSTYEACIVLKVRQEVNKVIKEKTNLIFELYRQIINMFPNLDQPFSNNDLNELKCRFNTEIILLQQKRDETHKLLLFIEDFLLSKIAQNPQSKKVLFYDCFKFFRDYDVQLQNTARNYERQHNTTVISLPVDRLGKNKIDTIKNKLNLKNQNDAKILALYIYYLQSKQMNGVLLTFDYHDFLVHASQIELDFPAVCIFRPSYLQCIL